MNRIFIGVCSFTSKFSPYFVGLFSCQSSALFLFLSFLLTFYQNPLLQLKRAPTPPPPKKKLCKHEHYVFLWSRTQLLTFGMVERSGFNNTDFSSKVRCFWHEFWKTWMEKNTSKIRQKIDFSTFKTHFPAQRDLTF